MVEIYGFAVEHAQDEEDAYIFPVLKKGDSSDKASFIGLLPNYHLAKKYSHMLIDMWEIWTEFYNGGFPFSEEYLEASGNPSTLGESLEYKMFGNNLGHFTNGNYEKILVIAKEGDTVVGHWWSAVSSITLDPRDGFQSELVEEDFDKELLYKQAQRYI